MERKVENNIIEEINKSKIKNNKSSQLKQKGKDNEVDLNGSNAYDNEESITQLFNYITENKNFFYICFLIHTLSIFIKILIGTYGYSGEKVPPKYGDFEAQRHWMEITNNIPIKNWYTNSTENSDTYWPIDYPPMSAYYSYVWGKIFSIIIPGSIELNTSHGYENLFFKRLMRFSVLISDTIFYHLSIQIFLQTFYLSNKVAVSKYNYIKIYIGLILALFSPCICLIDNGHFQYNCVMLGCFVLAFNFLLQKRYILSIIFITISINFKQMGLYYALPFGLYAVKHIFKSNGFFKSIIKSLFYLLVLIFTLTIIWYPWIYNQTYSDVLTRIFPLWRGIFEDKVASFWCTLNMVEKLANYDRKKLLIGSIALTTAFSIPSITILIKKSRRVTSLCFLLVSLSFFLFSFHVHEKTIIVPYVAFILCYEDMKVLMPSFVLLSSFSLYPLLSRENQELPYLFLTLTMFIFAKIVNKYYDRIDKMIYKEKGMKYVSGECILPPLFNFLDYLNLVLVLVYHYSEFSFLPPQKLPYLFPALNAAYCFCWFFLIYFSSFIRAISISSFDDCN